MDVESRLCCHANFPETMLKTFRKQTNRSRLPVHTTSQKQRWRY